jgi:hypothetical protein
VPDTADLDERRAQLDAAIRAEFTTFKTLLAERDQKDIDIVASRVRLWAQFEQRLAITPKGERTRYVTAMAREFEFKRRKAYDNSYFHYLHHVHQFGFATLAKNTVEWVRNEAIKRRGSGHADAGEARAEVVENTVNPALYDLIQYNQQEQRRQRLEFQRREVDYLIYTKWWADSIDRAEPVLPEGELQRGLTNVMIDSGGFSAAQLEVTIPNPEYRQFVFDNLDWIGDKYFVLDEFNEDDPNDAAFVSYYQRFKEARERWGLNPIPVIQPGQDDEWLYRYLDEGCETIALGGVARSQGRKTRNRRFYEGCFRIIEQSGRPIRVHLLGVATPEILLRHDFASADAATWILSSQRYQRTDLSRLGSPAWVASLTMPERMAAATFLEAHDAHQLELEIREQRPHFDFYLVYRLGNPWALPALRLVQHRSALISYWGGLGARPERLREFIETPDAVLAHPRYERTTELLRGMKARYEQQRDRINEIVNGGVYRPLYTD